MNTMRQLSCVLVCGLATSVAAAEPISQTLTIERIATIENMGRMSVNSVTGEIAFGRTGPGNADAYRIRVMDTDGSVREIGSPIADPDAVTWDTQGSFSPAGSILVGSNRGLFAVHPDESVSQIIGAGQDISNPEDMVMGDDGALYFADYGLRQVQRLSIHGSFSTVATTAEPTTRVAIDWQGNISALDRSGMLTSASQGGTVNARLTELVFGDGSMIWGNDRYAIDADAGSLIRILSDGSSQTLATGFFDGINPDLPGAMDAHIGFAPTGEMLVGVPSTDSVFVLVPSPGAATIAALGGLLAMKRRR